MLERLPNPSRRTLGALAVAVAAGLLVGWLLVPRSPTPDDERLPLPPTTFLGSPLVLDAQAPQVALSRARRHLAGEFRLRLPDGRERKLAFGRLGVELDRVHLAGLIRDARDRTSPLLRVFRASRSRGPLDLPLPVTLEPDLSLATLLGLKDELDRLPVDARLDLDKRELVHEVRGRLLDVDATLRVLTAALYAGKSEAGLVFRDLKPKRLAAELGNVEFGHVLGYFETPYDRSQRYEARTYNLRLAASKLDGYVLLPGEVFDFNEVVGPRDEANGYKVAPVIAEGELVDGIGGGTCQVSGTLHGAAFFAGLEITERYSHTRPSSYIKLGLDATVVYPTINFRIRNNRRFPIVLRETVKNGVVRAEILGPAEQRRTVTLIRRIEEALAYEEVERPDKDLVHGKRILLQRGVPGFKLRRYRIVREGQHAVRERWDDVYPPTPQIVRVGVGEAPGSGEPPKDDTHGEYLADELLVMTQGDNADDGGDGATRENREPGRFGSKGWTEAAGMPYYRTSSEPVTAPASRGTPEKKPEKS